MTLLICEPRSSTRTSIRLIFSFKLSKENSFVRLKSLYACSWRGYYVHVF